MARYSALIQVMKSAAIKAARNLVRDFGEVENLQVSRKGPGDFVTIADIKAERTLRQELGHARPDYGFLMEESGAEAGRDGRYRWIVDPLDGTTNFLHGIPHFAISIGLEHDGQIIAGLIYHPVADEIYWAERGIGAYLNDRRIRVSARTELADALLATGVPPAIATKRHGVHLAALDALLPRVAGVRRSGSAALDLAYLAAGRYDGYWELGLGPWDMAAGILLVREAGGFVSDLDGRDRMLQTGAIVAGTERVQASIRKLLRDTGKTIVESAG